jgi:hypothetical protein
MFHRCVASCDDPLKLELQICDLAGRVVVRRGATDAVDDTPRPRQRSVHHGPNPP